MSYATPDDVRQLDADLGPTEAEALPATDAPLERLIARAARDIDRLLGASYLEVLDDLTVEQQTALRDACCCQALFLHRQGPDALLGLDDGLAGIGPISFSLRRPPRITPAAEEAVAGMGLIVRSGTVPLEDADDAAPAAP